MKSKLILGTAQFGMDYGINNDNGKPSFKKIKEILDFAHSNAICLLDTAEAYGDSQERIGQYHKTTSKIFNIITKFSTHRKDLSLNIKERINQNLKTLEVNSIYCYMFHSFEDYLKYFSFYQNDLIDLIEKKIIKKIGVSLHSNKDIELIFKNDLIKVIQLPFNLLDNSSHRKKILLKAKHLNIEVHTRSVFLQGLFFKNPNEISGNLIELRKNLKQLNNLISKENMHDLALNYAYSKNYIDGVLLGVDNLNHLKLNINCIESSKTKSIINKVDEILITNKSLLNPANWKS